jgi:transcriptional regulator with PAS, ATPase and Fis domain
MKIMRHKKNRRASDPLEKSLPLHYSFSEMIHSPLLLGHFTAGGMAELLLDIIPIGVILCDRDNIVQYINKTYAAYLQIDRQTAIGNPITELIPTSRAQAVIKSGIPELTSTCRIQRSDGQVTLIVNRLPVKNDAGDIVGFVSQSIIADTDETKELAEKIRQLDKKVVFYRRRMRSALSAFYSLQNIIGGSAAIQAAKMNLSLYARSESPMLILGETGTGKELFASAFHQESDRADGPFVCINSASIPLELFESELFGYMPGAFSGAHKEGKVGQIELAEGGTLFLDEIGDMPLQIQSKLLRVIEDKRIYRLGSSTPNKVNFRLVAATHKDLKKAIQENLFREDLYYRINSLVLHVPPLRQRTEDILPLIRHFLDKLNRPNITFTKNAMQAMVSYSWPGNIRELRNVVDSAVSLCGGKNIVELAALPPEIVACGPFCRVPDSATETLKSLAQMQHASEHSVIQTALEKNDWNMAGTARKLGISRATLYKKTTRLGITRKKA